MALGHALRRTAGCNLLHMGEEGSDVGNKLIQVQRSFGPFRKSFGGVLS